MITINLRQLAAIAALLLSTTFSYSQCCTYTLTMNDSFGDGWTGATLSIFVNGSPVLTNVSAAGTGTTTTFAACTGDAITYTYSTGTFENDNSWSITDEATPVANVIDSDGPAPTAGTFNIGSGTATCPETCSDGIQNQDETGVDCGGTSCTPCHCSNGVLDGNETSIDFGGDCGNCNDGIQNGPETGIDCGGPLCIPCNQNTGINTATQCCDATAMASVYPTNCDQIGTSAYNNNSPVVEFTSQNASGCLPTTGTSCGGNAMTGTGSWTHMTLEDGVTFLQASWAQGANDAVANGNSTTYSSLYQGSGCGSLSFVDCQAVVEFSSSNYFVYNATWSGLDPTQDVWIYTWNSANKNFNFDFQFVGVQSQPTNLDCANSSAALGAACNLGATGASFTTPGACSGGSWGSNENTTFYSFTADATSGSLEIQNITCNDGTNGAAQFGVWTSCANIGTGTGFLGCAVGTATLSLTPLIDGQTYYIAADGFAGDNCSWGFTGTGIILPMQLKAFKGLHTGQEVYLDWTTITETDNDYFTIQRTEDGIRFDDIGMVDGSGTTANPIDYAFIDKHPLKGTSYYRIKQTDHNGDYMYSEVITLRFDSDEPTIVRTVNLTGQEVDVNHKGMVIDIMSDGTTQKRVNQ